MHGSCGVYPEDVILLDGTYSSCGILSTVPTYRMGEAAELLGVSPDTVRRWSDAGRLPTLRTEGGHRRIDGAALAGFAASLAAEQRPPAIVSESARNRLT